MMSPVVALGVGHFGVDFGIGFPITVILAHIAFRLILGWIISNRNATATDIITIVKRAFNN